MLHRDRFEELRSELLPVLTFYQKVLRLQPWDIELEILRQADMEDALGLCEHHEETSRAKITIAHPDTISSDELGLQDPVEILVHELLHLVLIDYGPEEEPARARFERGLNLLMRIVIEAHPYRKQIEALSRPRQGSSQEV